MPRFSRSTTALFVVTMAVAPLAAQDTTTARKPVRFTGDVGFVNTSGNTNVTTLNVGERIEYAITTRWGLTQTFAVVYGRTDGETNTSNWRGGLRGDYRTGRRFSLYGRLEFSRNTFAGISQRFEEGIGAAYAVIQAVRDTLAVEAGGSDVQQRSTDGLDETFVGGRAAVTYRHLFTEKALFSQFIELLPNLEQSNDYLLNTETALTAPLSSSIALKLSYVIHLDNLPEPGREKTDRLFTSGLQISF